jgi:hypothetical protein
MNKLRIGIDLDDTVVAFMDPYIQRFGYPKTSYEINYNVFSVLRKDKEFWMNTPILNIPDFVPTLICSKRCHPKSWSKKYLADKIGIPNNVPFYQLFCQFMPKSKILKGKIDVYIDDSVSNFNEINSAGIPCLLMDSKFNREFDTPLRIFSLKYEEIKYIYSKNFRNI